MGLEAVCDHEDHFGALHGVVIGESKAKCKLLALVKTVTEYFYGELPFLEVVCLDDREALRKTFDSEVGAVVSQDLSASNVSDSCMREGGLVGM